MKLIRPLVLLVLLVQLLPSPAAAAGGGTRLYLLATSAGDGYWSVDPADPELSALTTHRTCGGVAVAVADGSCASPLPIGGTKFEHLIPFAPATLIDDLGAHAQPLKFHLRLDVGTSAPFTVQAAIDRGTDRVISAPATQVAPGVWEGTLQESYPLGGTYNTLSVIIRSDSPTISVTAHTAGHSWFELSRTIAARSVPALKHADNAPITSSYTGAGRTLRFTDDNWTATSFTGDLTKTRTFQHDLARPATMVIAWVETFDSPVVYDVMNQRQPDPRRLENSPQLKLMHDAGQVSGMNTGIRGRGQDSVAALDVAAGRLDLEVSPSSWDPDKGGQSHPYEVHVVAVHGQRTLRSMRWRFATGYNLRSPVAASCPYGYEPVPVPSNVTTFSADLDWRTFAQPAPAWTVSFEVPSIGFMPCGERTQDDRVSFTLPPLHQVWMLGPAPSQRALYASTDDTVFQMQVDYTYGP
jgi:hypothetical protein